MHDNMRFLHLRRKNWVSKNISTQCDSLCGAMSNSYAAPGHKVFITFQVLKSRCRRTPAPTLLPELHFLIAFNLQTLNMVAPFINRRSTLGHIWAQLYIHLTDII